MRVLDKMWCRQCICTYVDMVLTPMLAYNNTVTSRAIYNRFTVFMFISFFLRRIVLVFLTFRLCMYVHKVLPFCRYIVSILKGQDFLDVQYVFLKTCFYLRSKIDAKQTFMNKKKVPQFPLLFTVCPRSSDPFSTVS